MFQHTNIEPLFEMIRIIYVELEARTISHNGTLKEAFRAAPTRAYLNMHDMRILDSIFLDNTTLFL